jgi:cytochrome d ubiquinol oxidase subunit I
MITGDLQGKVMTEVQPMKMSAAEALWDSRSDASFSLFTIGTRDATREVFGLRVPYLLSYLAAGDVHAEVEGINDIRAEDEQRFGPGDYTPHIPTTYWSFRYMTGLRRRHHCAGASRHLAHPTWQASGHRWVARVHLDNTVSAPPLGLRLPRWSPC